MVAVKKRSAEAYRVRGANLAKRRSYKTVESVSVSSFIISSVPSYEGLDSVETFPSSTTRVYFSVHNYCCLKYILEELFWNMSLESYIVFTGFVNCYYPILNYSIIP